MSESRRRRQSAARAALVAVLLSCQPASSALAADRYPEWVRAIRDCANDGKVDGTYSAQALRKAISELPSFEDEYYGCTDTLRHALQGGSGRHEPPPPNGIATESGAVAATPEDVAALQRVQVAADTGEPLQEAADFDGSGAGPVFMTVATRESRAYPLWVARDALLATLAALLATLCLHGRRRRAR